MAERGPVERTHTRVTVDSHGWSSQDRERSQAAEPKTDGPLPPELAEHRLKYYQCLRYVQGGTDWIFQLVQFS